MSSMLLEAAQIFLGYPLTQDLCQACFLPAFGQHYDLIADVG